jgi:hypothetical protein
MFLEERLTLVNETRYPYSATCTSTGECVVPWAQVTWQISYLRHNTRVQTLRTFLRSCMKKSELIKAHSSSGLEAYERPLFAFPSYSYLFR